jgi:hypothetical protein
LPKEKKNFCNTSKTFLKTVCEHPVPEDLRSKKSPDKITAFEKIVAAETGGGTIGI